jgi:LPXTG-motif cell wall-anchored protein
VVWEPVAPVSGQPLGWSVRFSVQTDNNGNVRIDGLPIGRYLLGAQDSTVTEEVQIAHSGESDVSLCVEATTNDSGQLPGTGSSSLNLLFVGLALTVVGGLFARRRRRPIR